MKSTKAKRKRRMRRKAINLVTSIVMVVSFAALLFFVGIRILPEIQAKRVKSQIPKPDFSVTETTATDGAETGTGPAGTDEPAQTAATEASIEPDSTQPASAEAPATDGVDMTAATAAPAGTGDASEDTQPAAAPTDSVDAPAEAAATDAPKDTANASIDAQAAAVPTEQPDQPEGGEGRGPSAGEQSRFITDGYFDEEGDFIRYSEEADAPISAVFAELLEKNEDTVGWLTAGEDIDFPVVRGKDDFYLHHNYLRETDINGSIFLTEDNVLRPRDTVLLIYGHNMAGGEMFGRLDEYRKESYMREHALIAFRTIFADEQDDCWYVPVSIFSASMVKVAEGYFDITPLYFYDEEEHQAYIDEILERSEWTAPTDVTIDDDLMVLITCSYNYSDARYLLFCRKLRADETPDMMRALYMGEQ